ncbi:MAG: FkbM family methyltransferase [Afipia sp.]
MLNSYAQNLEDVILWRALKDVENGFYIDIGAQEPVFDSVSLAFYEHGWRGVHIEPSSTFAHALREARPDETVIEAFVGGEGGPVQFYEIPETGLSTGDRDLADKHAADGLKVVPKTVASIPLAKILETYRDRDIHWLKIDVEGHEAAVIDSWLPSTVRPWIVVVEATVPRSQAPSFEGWEPTLLGLGYDFMYFDGLNRFYLSHSHLKLAERFGPGPNFFDAFQLTNQSLFTRALTYKYEFQLGNVSTEAERLKAEIASVQAGKQLLEEELIRSRDIIAEQVTLIEDARRKLSSNESELARLRNVIVEQVALAENANRQVQVFSEQIDTIYRSTSWRVTAPLRWLGKIVRR